MWNRLVYIFGSTVCVHCGEQRYYSEILATQAAGHLQHVTYVHPILLFLPHIVNFSTVLWWVMTYLDTHIWIVCSQDCSCEFTQVPTLMKSRIWTPTLYSCWFICSMRHSVKSNQIQRVSHRQQWPHHSASWECAGTFTISTSFDSLAPAWTSSLSSDNINLWWLGF